MANNDSVEQDSSSSINDWYMRTAFASDDNNNPSTGKLSSTSSLNNSHVKPATDEMILQIFETSMRALNWKEFCDNYLEVQGAYFPETEQEAVEAMLVSIPGIEVFPGDGNKTFCLIDVLSSSLDCSIRDPLPSYISYDNSSIGVHTALEFEAALEEECV